ncbi:MULTISPECIES: DNA-binding protein [unclassified Pseudomonas]|uniref:DNA-binding protein n=1 Tax=unclassified Pseudomonas TaxID=196821 RepID=UPI000799DBDE|nr:MULTISPECIES: DNA-binding protein [unclassified Pseudomonas]KXJ31380.1 DNA-binding protein [Pseudomonas sp. HUK17]MCD4864750.1 DNA-binding protein [Pseudomonas sp. PLB05]NRH40739.1 DNA-binding protein [Pseudomonas sp. MS15a(2019)]
MTLDNLLGKSLEAITPDPASIQRLLEAAQRSLTDACLPILSSESRFDLAYKAIMQGANAALQANGYRTLTSRPGHHQTMIQSLPRTVELDTSTMLVLDTLRKQRNVIDYSGDLVSDSMAQEALQQAEVLLQHVTHWLKQNRPELLSDRER